MEKKMPKRVVRAVDIAPCGINCALCMAYGRKKNPCFGCKGLDETKPRHCRECSVVHCEYLQAVKERHQEGQPLLCIDCEKYPCRRIKQLDKRYQTRYGLSNRENMRMMKEKGMDQFLAAEQKKWRCGNCGEILCMHRRECEQCGAANPNFTG